MLSVSTWILGMGALFLTLVQRVLDLLSHLPWPDYVCPVFGFSDHTYDFEREAFYLPGIKLVKHPGTPTVGYVLFTED